MKKETIKICGKEVDMLYCAAAETSYEKLSGKSSEGLIPKRAMSGNQPVNDPDGNPIYNAPAKRHQSPISIYCMTPHLMTSQPL